MSLDVKFKRNEIIKETARASLITHIDIHLGDAFAKFLMDTSTFNSETKVRISPRLTTGDQNCVILLTNCLDLRNAKGEFLTLKILWWIKWFESSQAVSRTLLIAFTDKSLEKQLFFKGFRWQVAHNR